MNLSKLKSRKLWLTVLGSGLTVILTQIGLPIELAGIIIGFLGGTYNIGQGLADRK